MKLVRSSLMIVLAASVALGTVNVASAHDKEWGSKISIERTKKGFGGKVTSKKDSCKKGRLVNLYKVKNGKFIGDTETNRRGKWSIKVGRGRGKYDAVATPKYFGGYGHLHLCSYAQSKKAMY